MRRLVNDWWLVAAALAAAVVVVAVGFYAADRNNHRSQQLAKRREAAAVLGGAVHDVLAGELALARVIGVEGVPTQARWPALASVVTTHSAATSAGFIVPVPGNDRAAFERRTGVRLLESPAPGELRRDPPRSLYLVSIDAVSKSSTKPVIGIDVSSNQLRRDLLLQSARTGRQLATPPVELLGRAAGVKGVIVYTPVFSGHRLDGWVAAAYQAAQLGATIGEELPGVDVTVRDGSAAVLGSSAPATGQPQTVAVAGRRWEIWVATPGSGITVVPWLVLGLGLPLSVLVGLTLRQAATRERHAAGRLAQHGAEEAALGKVATLVAQGAAPAAVFASVAEAVGGLLGARTAAVSRFERDRGEGQIVGGWASDGGKLTGAVFSLDGMTASAEVFRTGRAARNDEDYASDSDPIAPLMTSLGTSGGVAAPIVVDGKLWGALGSAYGHETIPDEVEHRLERFGRLVGLAISNADAREKLDREASTDPLTGIANRRVFDELLISEVARVRRYGRELSVAMFDLDHFKQINDTKGHQVGDRALVAFTEVLVGHARQGDLVARVGGEEFAWLMPETGEEGAYIAADRVRAAIEQLGAPAVGPMTVSAGVSTANPLSTADTLLGDADRALYQAKRAGRNRTIRSARGDAA